MNEFVSGTLLSQHMKRVRISDFELILLNCHLRDQKKNEFLEVLTDQNRLVAISDVIL